MKIKTKPEEIFAEYQDGITYNTDIDLYNRIEKNQRFYNGDQWYGVNAPGLMKPVFNIVKQVINYYMAMIVSDDIGISITPMSSDEKSTTYAKILGEEVDKVVERARLKKKFRLGVRNAALDGDSYMYINFDPDIDTGGNYKGEITGELLESNCVLFGNQYSSDLQKQPYIIIKQRLYTEQVKEMARASGFSDVDVDMIRSDAEEELNYNEYSDSKLTTVLTKFWKVKRDVAEVNDIGLSLTKSVTEVHYCKVCRGCALKEDVNLEYKYYPLASMQWEDVKQSYHGESPITSVIPNQIYINKMFAMCMVYTTLMGFPRVLFDSTKFKDFNNSVGKAYGAANLDMLGKIMDAAKAPDFSNQITALIDMTINRTKEFLGANDVALGNVKNPDNTSALIATQEASSAPLEIQKLGYHDFVEEIVRIIIDVMSHDYGSRSVKIDQDKAEKLGLSSNNGQTSTYASEVELDFGVLADYEQNLNVDVGQSSYWSETTQIQTLDALLSKGIITDSILYLESVPDKYIKNKQKIIDDLKVKQSENDKVQTLSSMLINLGVSREQIQQVLTGDKNQMNMN